MPAQPRSRTVGCFIALVILTVIAGITYAVWYRSRTASRGHYAREEAQQILRSEIRHLTAAEAQYYTERARFSDNLDSLQFIPTPGVSIDFERADAGGWRAVFTHTERHVTCSAEFSLEVPVPFEPVCE